MCSMLLPVNYSQKEQVFASKQELDPAEELEENDKAFAGAVGLFSYLKLERSQKFSIRQMWSLISEIICKRLECVHAVCWYMTMQDLQCFSAVKLENSTRKKKNYYV